MKKSSKLILSFFIIVILVIFLAKIFKVNKVSYKIKYDNKFFNVVEIHESDNYYFEIKTNNTFSFRINMNKGRKVVNKIYYYNDKEYECILPVIDDKITIDMMCFYGGIMYNYSNLLSKNDKLDNYVNSITEYNDKIFLDNTSNYKKVYDLAFYNLDIINHNVYSSTYKGIASNVKSVKLFDNDIYNNEISLFLGKYYVSADYNSNYEFDELYVINLKNHKKSKIKSKNSISFDTYIQGVVDNKVYLYDKDNEIQYELNIDKKSIKEISSNTEIKYYDNGTWRNINKPSVNKEVYFNFNTLNNYFTGYDKVVETDNYYYLIKKYESKYNLYRVDVRNIDVVKYITTIYDTNLYYNDDYIYYVIDNKLMYYSDITGVKTIMENNELRFNKNIKYYVY